MVAAERIDPADLAETPTTEQWDTPSLCEGWTVRHVFAHVVMGAAGDVWGYLLALLTSGFRITRASLRVSIADGDTRDPRELVADLRRHAGSRKRPPGTTPAGLLAEALVHGQDMRRPLGIGRVPPFDRLERALSSMVRTGAVLGNKKRIAGLELVATDRHWSHGDGPEVRGPAEALLMATCGRRVALDDMAGPGLEVLRWR